MTSSNPTRRPSRRSPGRGSASSARNVRSEVGERLRDAREIRGVDLHRVERDTKIRIKYLAALENGEFAELPGDVYARGFLRNYATYLGLDADELEEDWRSEAGSATQARPAFVGAPQPLRMERRVVFQRSHLVIAMVAIIVLVVGSYFGYQLTRYLSYPTLAVASAGSKPIYLPMGTTTYVLTGDATPGTTVLIAWNGQDPKVILADPAGHWTYQVVLQPGQNQFDITAKNLDTNHASNVTRIIIVVLTPTPTPVVPSIVVMTPADGVFVGNSFTVTGTAKMVAAVTLTPIMVGAPLASGATLPPATPTPPRPSQSPSLSPSASPTAANTSGPQPQTMQIGADGLFTFTVKNLPPGRWQLQVVGISATGAALTQPVSRTVSAPYNGLFVVIQVKGGRSSLSYFHDNVADDAAGYIKEDGWTASVTATRYVCLNAAAPEYVYVTVNGKSYGAIIQYTQSRLWIDASGLKSVLSCTA